MRRIFRIARRVVTHPVFIVLVVVLALDWFVFTVTRPVIDHVPVAQPGQPVTLTGHGFGNRQNDSYLIWQFGDQRVTQDTGLTWSNGRVVATPPDGAASGTVQVMKHMLFTYWLSDAAPVVVSAPGLPSEPFGYAIPVQDASPWPLFRRDERNTGSSPLPAVYAGDAPWAFATGKGIFSTPVIDANGTLYVGSADHTFYAIGPDGRERWRYTTGEIIDSAAALPRPDPQLGGETVLVPSGDGYLYRLRTAHGITDPADRVVWQFDARVAARESYNNWWEGNVGISYDSTLLAGNTNFNYYAIDPAGTLRWVYPTGANNWSLGGLGSDGTIFWGSNDTFVHAVTANGQPRWTHRTLGFIAASAAIGTDGTVYIGSFDSYLYALDPHNGGTRWRFKTNDHIYSSAALGSDASGVTNGIYVSSADGLLYALNPDGTLRWQYDTGDPIRSSPALGAGPDGARDAIVYFGSGNGKLYALDAATGTRRWSFDTTPDDPELRDRNDLNASPALGRQGIYIGGEHGFVWYVPYDYCLHQADPRCSTESGSDLPDDIVGLYYVTPGGSTLSDDPAVLPASTILTLRLLVREQGETIDAWVCNSPIGCPQDAVTVTAEPAFPFRLEHSADGHYLHIIPDTYLTPGQTYSITVSGDYYTGGLPVGNVTLGGRRTARFEDTLNFRVADDPTVSPPLAVGPAQTTAFEWTRLAAPLPPMLPSLNQIGFDYMDWIVGTVDGAPAGDATGKVILWAIGGKRDADGRLVADAASEFTLPLSGTYQDDSFILANKQFVMPITGIPIPFNEFQLRGRFGDNLRVEPGATAYADTDVLSIPTFGPYLAIAGLANNWIEKLIVAGTYITRPYPPEGPANQRPDGIEVGTVTYTAPTASAAGRVDVTFRLNPGAAYPLDAHRAGIVLVDSDQTVAVPLDYHNNLTATADANGNLASASLTIPAGTTLPPNLKAIVVLDVFPLHTQILAP